MDVSNQLELTLPNGCRPVDAHSQNAAVTTILSALRMTAANMTVMNNSDQITNQLLCIHDNESLTLC
jgi:hypothetical protein